MTIGTIDLSERDQTKINFAIQQLAERQTAISAFGQSLLDDPDAATFTVSADRRFSANSNDTRVRVDASKNRLTIVEPRRVGTFLIARSLISLNGPAVSRINRICSGVSGSSANKSFPSGVVTLRPRA